MNDQYGREPNFERAVPPGDNMERSVCSECGFVDYQNPKIVVGSVTTWNDKILLCRRSIEPRSGFWTLPAGYLELHETPEVGAKREAQEEACASIEIDRVLAIYSIPRISQVQIIYRATLKQDEIAAGPESQEVKLFPWNEIPWTDLAFPSVDWALRHYREVINAEQFSPFSNPQEGL
ncbi:NUDIX hydrolase [Hyphococcus flavus]|uniref:NUDIX hydrolase n=1 Tax=Hyphococcus flavus TaxID=1866326 RepID=A0AAE9ZD90_9PROT|nr:NUDIX hydrolase [Hyphococcus flavus]WDI32888.1 NUDIX hydrolase [Hyphococcus flavus]